MTDREKIAGRIRALKAKTVANGCTEDEALAAAALLAKLLGQYNMTLDEAELRQSPFTKAEYPEEDTWIGEKLWVVADGISYLTGARYWSDRPGCAPKITFFGFSHEVEVASYLLDLCSNAMYGAMLSQFRIQRLNTNAKRRRAARPFIDGMASRLRERLREMKPPAPTGRGLIVLRDQLVLKALEDAGLKFTEGGGHVDLDAFAGHAAGRAAGDRVALNPGLASAESVRMLA